MNMTSRLRDAYDMTKVELYNRGYIDRINPEFEAFTKLLLMNIGMELDKPIELKIKRSEDAKQFPLLHTKKDGDVGYDLPAILPYKDEYKFKSYRDLLLNKTGEHTMCASDIDRIIMRECIVVKPHEKAVIPTGIHLELPHGYWAAIEARSSTSQQLLVVPKGVIDEGYRGELFAVVINVGEEPVVIRHGDRVVQLIIKKRESSNINIVEVDELTPSDRGSSGFGSTGR